MKLRTHYEVVFNKWNFNETNIVRLARVDAQNKDDVYYMLHVYLCNPDADIYVCYNDGTKSKIILQ